MKGVAVILSLLIFLSAAVYSQDTLPNRYHRYQGVVDTFTQLQNLFPSILHLDTIGYSTRDTIPLIRLKISDNAEIDEDEPSVLFAAGVHADEVLGTEVVYNFVQDITRRYADHDPEACRYIRELEISVVPFINPEGQLVVENGDLDWRKNKSDNDTNGVFDYHDGVDNNRNYDLGWEYLNGDNSNNPTNLMFRGYAPFTESENIAMRDLGRRYKPVAAVDYHSPITGHPEIVYFPWSGCPDYLLMQSIAESYADLTPRIHNGGHYSCIYGLLNKGDFKNYFYGNFGTAALCIEVSDTTIEDTTLVDQIVEDHLAGQYYLLQRSLGPGIAGIVRDSVTFEPLEAEVQVIYYSSPIINPRYSDPHTGRYRRLLEPGNYRLRFLKDGYVTKTVNDIVVADTNAYSYLDVLLAPINPCPPAPELVQPSPGEVVEDNEVLFSWLESEYADGYILEVSLNSYFRSIAMRESVYAATEYISPPLKSGICYHWRVRPFNENGSGPYSSVRGFFIDFKTSIDQAENLPVAFQLLQNYPNPFNIKTRLSFYVQTTSNVELSIYNLTGAVVAKPLDKVCPKGWHNLTWEARDFDGLPLPSGIYFYSLQVEGVSQTRKLTLLK